MHCVYLSLCDSHSSLAPCPHHLAHMAMVNQHHPHDHQGLPQVFRGLPQGLLQGLPHHGLLGLSILDLQHQRRVQHLAATSSNLQYHRL